MPTSKRSRPPALVRRLIEPLARFGFGARGAVYVVIGCLAARAAVRGRRPTDTEGALRMVGQQTHGDLFSFVCARYRRILT